MGDSELLKPNSKKSLSDALANWFANFSDSFCAIKVGKVIDVDYSNQTVDVEVLHKRIKEDTITEKVLRTYPPLLQVPFIVLGGGGSSLTFPISKGDNCLLLFCDFEIDRWWESGEAQPSNYDRKHDISDAFAIIGVHSMVDLLQGYSQYVQLKYSNDSKITVGNNIELDNQEVNATGNVTANGIVTARQIIAENGYSGVVPVGPLLLSFANGILISVE